MPFLTSGEYERTSEVEEPSSFKRDAKGRQVSEWDVYAFRHLFAGTNAAVLSSTDAGYAESMERWSRAAEKPAGVSIQPTSNEEVALGVKHAAEKGFHLAVKGGGHSTAGASSTDGGVLIDLAKMRAVTVDSVTQQIHIQGGARWGDVDNAAWEHRLATVGGTVADTGVGGLTLGGGYGMLTGKYGLVIDNLISVTIVLANGETKTASKVENADLFWALQGAGQNFGVATEFVLQGYPQEEVWVSMMAFPPTPNITAGLVKAINELYAIKGSTAGETTSNSNGQTMGLLGVTTPPHGGPPILMYVGIFNGPEPEGRARHKALFDLNPVFQDTRMVPYPTVNNLIPAAIGMRSSMKGAAFQLPIRSEFVSDMISEYERLLSCVPDAGQSLVAWELMDPTKVVAGDSGCFANRGYHLNAVVMPMWNQSDDDQTCRQWARDLSEKFKAELERHGERSAEGVEGAGIVGPKGAVMLYGNYDQYDERSRDIFGTNYPRLQALKAKYDPNNVFNNLFAITPKSDTDSI